MNVQHLTDDNFERILKASKKPLLVDFSATWCGPCRLQRPLLESLASRHPEVEVAEVDIEGAPITANKLGIHSVPTLVLFRGGVAIARAHGLQSQTRLEALVASGEEPGVRGVPAGPSVAAAK